MGVEGTSFLFHSVFGILYILRIVPWIQELKHFPSSYSGQLKVTFLSSLNEVQLRKGGTFSLCLGWSVALFSFSSTFPVLNLGNLSFISFFFFFFPH